MSAKFQVYKDAAGKFRFRLLDGQGKIVAVGEAYEQHSSCVNGIKSIQKNCNSDIEDLTIEEGPKLANQKYQVFKDAAGEFRFHLKASNGEIIAESKGYGTKEECQQVLNAIRNSCNAEIEDSTVPQTHPAETKTVEAPKPVAKAPNTVFIGSKMPMEYVMAILTGLSASGGKSITLKARGQAITTAVDAAEITRRRFIKNLKVASIVIGTESMPPREGETKPRMVSTIEITLTE